MRPFSAHKRFDIDDTVDIDNLFSFHNINFSLLPILNFISSPCANVKTKSTNFADKFIELILTNYSSDNEFVSVIVMEFLSRSKAILIDSDGVQVPVQRLEGKIVAFYFSAHWCHECQDFTPILKDFYEEVNGSGESKFEVIFVSSDENKDLQMEYMHSAHGKWLTIPHDSPLRNELKVKYGVCAAKEKDSVGVEPRREGIPALLVTRSDGSEITLSGVKDVQSAGPPVLKKWLSAS